jgi:hypothetical protein
MAYIGKNPRLKSIVSQGDTLANLTAESRVAGRLVWATDELKFYFDDGTALTEVGSGSGGGGVPLLGKGSLLTSDGLVNGDLAVGTDGQILSADSAETAGLKWIDAYSPSIQASAPTVNDDTYAIGDIWLDTTNQKAYICVDNTASNAVWIDLTASSSGGGMAIPTSVIATTGAYTVLAGQYAIVKAAAIAGTNLSINGTTVLSSNNLSWSTINVNSSPQSGLASGYRAIINQPAGNLPTSQANIYGNSTAYNRDSVSQSYTLPSGTSIAGNCNKLIEIYTV